MASTIRVSIIGDASSVQRAFASAAGAASGFGSRMQSAGAGLASLGRGLTAGVTVPIVGLGVATVKAASDFESSFAGVRKTVDATEPEFQKLAQGFRDMAKEIPVSVNELNAIGEAAGALGIEKENILSFTRTVADLGEATDMTADQAATSFARFANITQMPQTEFDRLGSTVVDLGNKLAATESEIVDMGMRIAGAGAQVGMTQADIMGLAGALSSVGIAAEAGGTAISTVMIKIAAAVNKGGAEVEGFAKVAGMSSQEFSRAWEQDAAGALVTFIEGLGRMKDAGGDVFGTLDQLGLGSIRVRDALLRASGAGDLFRKSLEIAEAAWSKNNALTEEAVKRYQTFASQLTVFKNKLIDVGITFGQAIIPFLTRGLDMLDPWIQKLDELANRFKEMTPAGQEMVLMIAGIAAAIGPALIVVGSLVRAFGTIAAVIGGLLSPFGLVVGALGALGYGLIQAAGGFDRVLPLAGRFLDWIRDVASSTSIEEAFRKISDGLDHALDGIGRLFERIDWGAIAAGATRLAEGILRWVADKIRGINWGQIANTITSGVADAITGAASAGGGLAGAAADLANAVIVAVGKALLGIDWGGLAKALGSVIGQMFTAAFNAGKELAQTSGFVELMYEIGYKAGQQFMIGLRPMLTMFAQAWADMLKIGAEAAGVLSALQLVPDDADDKLFELQHGMDRTIERMQFMSENAELMTRVLDTAALSFANTQAAAEGLDLGDGFRNASADLVTFQDGISATEAVIVGFAGVWGQIPSEKVLRAILQDDNMAARIFEIVQKVNEMPGSVETKAQFLKDEAANALSFYTGQLDLVPEFAQTQVSAPGATEAAAQVGEVSSQAHGVPPDARTNVSAPGATEAQSALEQIIQKAEKTKIPVVVKVSSPGAQEAIGKLEQLKTALGNVGDAIPTATRAFDQLKAGITKAVGEAVSEMKSAQPKFKSAAEAAGKAAVAGMKSGIAGLDQAAKAEASRAVSAMRGMVGQFTSVGAAMGSGVKAGFQSTIAGLAAQAAAAVSAAVAAARAAAQVGSPSRAMADQVGRPMGEGLIVGFLTGSRDLPSTVEGKVRESLERAKQTVDNYKGRLETAFGDLISDALSGFDRITSEHLTKTEQLIQNMELDRQIQELAQRVADAKAALDAALASGDAQAVLSAQRQLDQALYDQQMFALRQQAEQERKDYEDKRELRRRNFEEQLQQLQTALAKHPEKHKEIQQKIINLLKRYGLDYQASGINVGLAIAAGLRQSIPAVTSAAQAVAQAIANALKTASPTKEGPMSDLDRWLVGFAPAYLKGLDDERIRKALEDATMIGHDMPPAWQLQAGPGGPARVGVGVGARPINVTVNVQGSVTAERDLAHTVRNVLISRGQGLTGLGLS